LEIEIWGFDIVSDLVFEIWGFAERLIFVKSDKRIARYFLPANQAIKESETPTIRPTINPAMPPTRTPTMAPAKPFSFSGPNSPYDTAPTRAPPPKQINSDRPMSRSVTLGFGLRVPHFGQVGAPGATGQYQHSEHCPIGIGSSPQAPLRNRHLVER
jgi:hypothetical protein